MTAPKDGGKRRRRRHLTPQGKDQVWQEVVAGQDTQREIADRWGIDRSTVVHHQAGQAGRPGAAGGLEAGAAGRVGR